MRAPQQTRQRARERGQSPLPLSREEVQHQLASAVGAGQFRHRDPVDHLNECFCRSFEQLGRQRAEGGRPDLSGALRAYLPDESPGLWGERTAQQSADRAQSPAQEEGAMPDRGAMDGCYEPRERGEQGQGLRRFAELSFRRGRLSAAVLRGTGKMMLFSCLERTAGQEQSRNRWERTLFQRTSLHRLLPGQSQDLSIVNRGFVDSAVGLVVDVLRDARQVLDSFTRLAEGKGGPDGVGTLHRQYPFLSDQTERALLEQYRSRLEELDGPGCEAERQVLLGGMKKARAVIAKKDQMKRDFLHRLRQLSQQAAEAEAEFADEALRREAARLLEPPEEEPLPPEDGDGDDEDGGMA